MKSNYQDYVDFYSGNSASTHTVVEQDEVQLTKLLGPDGKPYAIRRPKMKLGFDLTPAKR
jgi:hypothetical protein